MTVLIEGLEGVAKKAFGKNDPRRALRSLYIGKELSPAEIGKQFGCTPTAVRYLLKKWKIRRTWDVPTGIKKNLGSLGFRTLEAYFKKNWHKTKEQMGADLGVSPITVANHYDAWVKKFGEGGSNV
jgi:uncharacterized protein YjcR